MAHYNEWQSYTKKKWAHCLASYPGEEFITPGLGISKEKQVRALKLNKLSISM